MRFAMAHVTTPRFWAAYDELPEPIRELADRNYELLKDSPRHPSLQFKKVGEYWSVRVGRNYRALGIDSPEGIAWLWIGPHDEYEAFIRS
jgi:uncharacterized protein (DUF427 family)